MPKSSKPNAGDKRARDTAGKSSKPSKKSDKARKPGKKSSSRQKPASAGASAAASIDQIFADVKAQAKEAAQAAAASKAAESKSKAQLAAKVAELETQGRAANRLKSPDSPVPLRFDPELGMNIYSVDSLKIGKGGDTALCPFDCDCCF